MKCCRRSLVAKYDRAGRACRAHGGGILAVCLAICLAGCDSPRDLRPGIPANGCRTSVERFRIAAGDDEPRLIHLRIEQSTADVEARLLAPGRTVRFDSLSGQEEPEHVWWIRESSEELLLEVEDRSRAGCEIVLEDPRPPTERDRSRVDAELGLAEAHSRRIEGTKDACGDAVAGYRRVLLAFRALGLHCRVAEAEYSLGLVQRDCLRDRRRDAIDSFRLARDSSRRCGNRVAESDAAQQLGELAEEEGDYRAAQQAYRAALRLRLDLSPTPENRWRLATTSNNLGLMLHFRGDLEAALNAFARAIELYAQLGDEAEAVARSNRGLLWEELGRTDRELADLERAWDIRRSRRDSRAAVAATALGRAQWRRWRDGSPGALDQARHWLEDAVELLADVDDPRLRAVTLTTLGLVYRADGALAAAARCQRDASSLFEQLGDRAGQASAEHNLGYIALARGAQGNPRRNAVLALAHFDEALRLLGARESPPADDDTVATAETRAARARALYERGRLAEARQAMQTAWHTMERSVSRTEDRDLRASHASTYQEHVRFYLDLLWESHRRNPGGGFDLEALELSEEARARSLLGSLTDAGAALAAPEYAAREERLLDEIASVRRDIHDARNDAGGDRSQAEVDRLELTLRRLRGELDEVRASGARYRELSRPREAGEIRQVASDAEALLLELAIGEERVYLWAVSADRIEWFQLGTRESIENDARRLHGLLADDGGMTENARTIDDLSRSLGERLLSPVAERLTGGRVRIVTDGALHTLPFSVLEVPAREESLGESHDLSRLPSASTAAVLIERKRHRRERRRPPRLAVIADPAFDPDPPATAARCERSSPLVGLSGAGREGRAILAMAPPGQHLELFGAAATKSRLVASDLHPYPIVHFATHGLFVPDDLQCTGLALASIDPSGERVDDSLLSVPEVYELDLDADLVVLSGCETGLGREIPGEGLVGLTQGFLTAGADHVVVSLWQVGDEATLELMSRLYLGLLRRGLAPDAALREAKHAMRAEGEYWSNPQSWAGFVIFGA